MGREWFADLIIDQLRTAIGAREPDLRWKYDVEATAQLHLGQRLGQSTASGTSTTVTCLRGVKLQLFSEATEAGWVAAFYCRRITELGTREIKEALAVSKELSTALGQSMDPAWKSRLGIPPGEERLADGSVRAYFPVGLFDHGAAFLPTLVYVPATGDYVLALQVEIENLCRNKPDARLCAATKEVLGKVASTLMTRPP